ncbi:wax ester/triacylglycerol synthase family O-acyltransferase, partial [Mycobacterium sp. ITM-2017-0098]
VVDGVSAANLLNQLLDRQPDAATPEPVEGPGDAAPWEIAADGPWRFVTLPWQLTKSVPATASMIAKTVSRAVAGEAMAAPFSAPT